MKVFFTIATAAVLLIATFIDVGLSEDNSDSAPCLGGGCYLPPVVGLFGCKAYFPRYFYNSTSGECQFFIYGGCQGTENNFGTEDDCLSACANC
ncbi:Kunitz-type protease inhibitor 2 [Elysia marginata]|uniref:Kunitz-type protease inhibitor 2 n=1 Tax=Elysia marginata TaxID=1093978 RepID=A0AAV4EQQ3_9GAST|nr:Kunitz-type protease inhibitor 2 [Elysia marginata]